MTQEVMDPMTKVTGATNAPWISPMCHVPPTETVPPMVHLKVVAVVIMNHPVVEEVILKGMTQIYPTINVLCIEVTQCPQWIEPRCTHLAYEQPMNIINCKCMINYFNYAGNTYLYRSRYLKEQKYAELTPALLGYTIDHPSSQTWKTGSSA